MTATDNAPPTAGQAPSSAHPEPDVVREVDARDLRCPLPLLKAKQALRELAPGQALRVLATDAGSVRDFQAFADLAGHTLRREDRPDGVYSYTLVKS